MRTAQEENVPCIDLGEAFSSVCARLGARRAKAFYQPDGVHLTQAGAERAAEVFVHLLRGCADKRLSVLCAVFGV